MVHMSQSSRLSVSRVRGTDNNCLRLVQVIDEAIGELKMGLNKRRWREGKPLVQTDVLVAVYTNASVGSTRKLGQRGRTRVEDLEELEGRVANVLDVVAEGAGNVAWERLSATMRALSLPDPLTNITSDVVESPGGTLGGEESDAGLALTDSAVSSV